jgi:hypothetical protein
MSAKLCGELERSRVDSVSVIFALTFSSSGVDSNLGISLFDKSTPESLELGQSDEWLLALSNNEHVGETGGEVIARAIFDVDDLIGTWVMLDVHELSDTTNVVSTLNEHLNSVFEFNDFFDLIGLKVELDSIVLLDFWVGVADGSAVVGHNIRNFVLAEALALHLAELEICLLGVDANWLEASLDVVHDTEVFVGFREVNYVLEA